MDVLDIHRELLKKYGLEAAHSNQNGDAYISTILLDDKQGPLYANLMNSGRESRLPNFMELLEERLKSLIDRSGISDKDKYLIHWGYTLGTPEAEHAWKEKEEFDNSKREKLHGIIPDIEPYESPIDGKVINSRTQRREDLERNNCRPWEGRSEESKEAQRRQQYIEQRNESALTENVSRAYYQLSPSKRDALRRR